MKEIKNFISNKQSDSLINFHKKNFNLNNSYSKKHRGTEVLQFMKMPKNSFIDNVYFILNKHIESINKNYEINYFEIVMTVFHLYLYVSHAFGGNVLLLF